MLTSSRIELASKCLGAFTLPHLRESNEWSDAGDERHVESEDAINRGDIPAVLADTWPDHTWRAEVAFGYDISTGEAREFGAGIGRAYPNLGPFWAFGTADAVGRNGAHLVIYDKKGFGDLTRAAENPQVRFLALAASRAYEAAAVEVATDHMLRGLDRADLEAFDLDETAHAIRQLLLDVAKAQNDARNGLPVTFAIGKHCRWCPAFMGADGPQCPKQRELAAIVKADQADVRVENTIPFRDDGQAADAYEFAKRLRMLLKRLDSALYARAAESPFAIGEGRMFGRMEKVGRLKLDGDIAYEVIRELHGQSVADAAVQRAATQKSIKEALGFVGQKGQVAALERTAMAAIKAKGGTSQKTTVEVGEYPVNQQLKAANE